MIEIILQLFRLFCLSSTKGEAPDEITIYLLLKHHCTCCIARSCTCWLWLSNFEWQQQWTYYCEPGLFPKPDACCSPGRSRTRHIQKCTRTECKASHEDLQCRSGADRSALCR